MGKLVITLEEQELLELQEILMDDDEKAALEFIKEHVATQIPGRGTSGCDSTRNNPYLMKGAGPS